MSSSGQVKQRLIQFLFVSGCISLGALIGVSVSKSKPIQVEGTQSAYAASAPPVTPNSNIFVELAKKAVPSVVNISTLTAAKGGPQGPWGGDELFKRFFEDFFRRHGGGGGAGPRGGGGDPDEEDGEGGGRPVPGQRPKSMSLGTGFIIEASGLILTNNHVVQGADEIKIQFTEDDHEVPTDGEVVGRDPELDLALIKVKTKRQLVPIALGDSDQLEVGEYVMAVGNPFGQGHSVSHGIISAKNRQSPDFALAKYLQTDTPINPGNSGGPLVNLKGEVIGINNAIDARAQGIGFAIPISSVKKVLPQLKTKGTVARGYIGILVNPLSPEIAESVGVSKDLKAPFVAHVYPGQPADQAGMKPYDVITEINGKKVQSPSELIEIVVSVNVGDKLVVKALRNKTEKTFTIKVAERPNGGRKEKEEKQKGKKEKPKKSKVETGMVLEDLTPETARELGLADGATGVLVTEVNYGGPADSVGVSRGDVIIEVDQKAVKNLDEFYAIVKDRKSYMMRVRRMDPQGQDVFAVIILNLKQKK